MTELELMQKHFPNRTWSADYAFMNCDRIARSAIGHPIQTRTELKEIQELEEFMRALRVVLKFSDALTVTTGMVKKYLVDANVPVDGIGDVEIYNLWQTLTNTSV